MKPFCRPAVLSLAFALAPTAFGRDVVDRILVRVNSRVITQSAFDARVDQASKDQAVEVGRREELKKSLMEEMVHEALLEDRAKDLDLITSDAEIEEQVKRLKDQNQVSTDEQFATALAASGLTLDKLRDQLRKSMTVQRVVGREVNSKVDLSDDALRIIYEREKETWRIAERVRLAEIHIAKGDNATSRAWVEGRIKECSDKLKAGGKFEDMVREFSDGATKSRGGDLGFVAKGDLNPEIDKVVFSLPVGSVSDPIQTKFGWHVMKVVDKNPVTYRPFNDVKADLLKREQETQFQKKLAEYLEKLKRDALIRVSQEATAYYSAPVYTVPAPPVVPPAKGDKKGKKA